MPPTDNLYKFIAISGIIIYLFSMSFGSQQIVQNRDLKYKYIQELIQVKDLYVNESIQMGVFAFKFNQYDKGYSLKDLSMSSLDSLILNYEQIELIQKYFLSQAKRTSNEKLQDNINERIEDVEIYEDFVRRIVVLLYALGACMFPFGFYLWYVKLHIPHMKLLNYEVGCLVIDDKVEKNTDFPKKEIPFYLALFFGCILLVVPIVLITLALDGIS